MPHSCREAAQALKSVEIPLILPKLQESSNRFLVLSGQRQDARGYCTWKSEEQGFEEIYHFLQNIWHGSLFRGSRSAARNPTAYEYVRVQHGMI